MPICRNPEYHKYHTICTEDVKNYGLERAAILGNIEKYSHIKYEELHKYFPYIEKEMFYVYVEDLIKLSEIEMVNVLIKSCEKGDVL